MNRRKPELTRTLAVAGGLALGAAAFLLAFVGKPTPAARIAAIAIIVLIVLMAVVWHWGFDKGLKWGDGE
jgi:peptidoglycan/LPS O-acetylase OafA/YrhL